MSKKKQNNHYVSNKEFSAAVIAYVEELNKAEAEGKELPIVPNYIADCFMRIAEGLSHKPSIIRYPFREEMVMDAVENCLRAIKNFDLEKAKAPGKTITGREKTGKVNAFSYFTQVSWWAFMRRIEKEKKQQQIKMKYIKQAGIDTTAMLHFNADDTIQQSVITQYMDTLKSRFDEMDSAG